MLRHHSAVCQTVRSDGGAFFLFPAVAIVDVGGTLLFAVVFREFLSRQFIKPFLGAVFRNVQGILHLFAGDGMVLLQIIVEEFDNLLSCIRLIPASGPTAVFVAGGSLVFQHLHETGVGCERHTLHLHIVGRYLVGVGKMRLDGVAFLVMLRLQANLHLEGADAIDAEPLVIAQLFDNLILQHAERRLHHDGVVSIVIFQVSQETFLIHCAVGHVTHLVSGLSFLIRQWIGENAVFDIVCHKTGCIGFVELVEQEQSSKAGVADHADGVDLQVASAEGGGEEEGDADPELPWILHWRGEIFLVAEQEGGGCEQAYNGRTQTGEYGLDERGVHVFHEHAADQNHQDEGWQD